MINQNQLYKLLEDTSLDQWKTDIYKNAHEVFSEDSHGDLKKWKSILENLPKINSSLIKLNSSMVQAGSPEDINSSIKGNLLSLLKKLHPWRKGPFNLFGIFIDTEWRSDLKWDRLKNHISPLKDRNVLDVGCGSGYHAFRMMGEGANRVIGLEPFLLIVIQFFSINHYINNRFIQIFPLSIEKFKYTC